MQKHPNGTPSTRIIGHMELKTKEILHRDISLENIRLGRKGESEPESGFCGVLIDLHMAIKICRDPSPLTGDRYERHHSSILLILNECFCQACRSFKSIALLLSCDPKSSIEISPAQDHLDDVESFFYVYTYIIHVCDSNGVSFPIPETIQELELLPARSVAKLKHAFLSEKHLPRR